MNIKFSRSKFSVLILIFLVINLFLMRPSALGQSYTTAAIIIAVFLFCFYFAINIANNVNLLVNRVINRDMCILFSLIIIYLAYTALISIYYKKSNLESVLREMMIPVLIVPIYGLFLLNKKNNKFFFSVFSIIISMLGYSAIITLLLALFVNIDSLRIFAISTKGYEPNSETIITSGGIYFPLTMLYGQFTSNDVILLRVAGFFREAGIYQAICCTCLVYEIFNRKSKIIIFGLLAGVVVSFSTAALFTLISTASLVFLYQAKKSRASLVAFLLIVALAYPVVVYTPYIGLAAKGDTHSTTISDRSIAASEGLKELENNLIGNGMFRSIRVNSGINLIASVGSIGLLGFIIQFIILSGWRFRLSVSDNKRIIACMPLLITALFSQPIAGAPLIYILTMMDFD